MTGNARDIGLDVEPPKESCSDRDCPFHGHLSVRGQTIEGTIVSVKMNGSVVVEKTYRVMLQKYQRYITRSSRYLAHLPPCVVKQKGDRALIAECRPLSKTVAFVVVE
jgi:small subunit ribosomal protein S17